MTGHCTAVSYRLRLPETRRPRKGREKTDPDGSPESGGSFDRRLSEARGRHGLDLEPAAPDQAIDRSTLGLVMRVGVELVSAVIVGLAIGWGLDSWLRTRPLFLILFVFLGGIAGIFNVWRLVSPDRVATRRGAAKTGGADRPAD